MSARLRDTLFTLVTTFLIVVNPTIADAADSAAYPATPVAVVERYLRLDSQGAWFSDAGRKELQKYTSDEIYITTIIAPTLITNYRIIKSESTDDQAWVEIEYRVVGYSENLVTFEPKNEIVRNTIDVKKLNGHWIIQTRIFPHIKWESVVKQIQIAKQKSFDYLATVDDDKKRRKLEAQIKYWNIQSDKLLKRITDHAQRVRRENNSVGYK